MAANCNIPFTVERKCTVLVKPSTRTPAEVLSLSTLDNNPNLERIGQIIFSYQANNDLKQKFSQQPDPASIIEEALSKLLVYYYPLPGKLKRQSDGKLQINCNADGVPFSVANADCKLSSLNYLDGIDVAIARQFVLDLPSDFDNGCHPLMFQVTKFACGGFTVAMGVAHTVFDGFGAAHFFRALTEIASKRCEPSVKPVWQRARLVAKPALETPEFLLDKNALATSPYLPTTDVVHEYFYVTAKSIKRLKTSLMEESQDQDEHLTESLTTLEVLGAYVWRSRFRALKLDPNGKTMIHLAVGIRHLLNPPLPDEYYGNAFITINVVLTGRDLEEGPLSKVVKLIKASKKLASTEDYIRTAMSLMEKRRVLSNKPDVATGALMVLTDWRQLGVRGEVDFGWKGFVNMTSLPWKIYGDLDHFMKGGVKVLVSLPEASMAKFKDEMNALKQGAYLITSLL
ncbi:hypothetical protein QQP08_026440 [Theobroma cacao]|nr:hypothetical protein QQP08_026440 [Theobroma cacao]